MYSHRKAGRGQFTRHFYVADFGGMRVQKFLLRSGKVFEAESHRQAEARASAGALLSLWLS